MTELQFNAIIDDFTKLMAIIFEGNYRYHNKYYGSINTTVNKLQYDAVNEQHVSHTEYIAHYADGSFKNKHTWGIKYNLDFKRDSYLFSLTRYYKYYSNVFRGDYNPPDTLYVWQKYAPVNNDFVDFMSNLIKDISGKTEGGGIAFDVNTANALVKSIIETYLNTPKSDDEFYNYIIKLTDMYDSKCSVNDIYDSIINEEAFKIRFFNKNKLLFTIQYYGDNDPFTIVVEHINNPIGDIVDSIDKLDKIIKNLD